MGNIDNFSIKRKFKNIETGEIVDFETVVNSSNISVILGEPASGKTYQLKEYSQKEFSYFIELINIEDEDEIEENISLILLDSIDEALTDYKNPKKFQSKLTKFIKQNRDKKFIITCRYPEWKKYFEEELKKLDKNLKIYEIVALSKEEINKLLKEEDREDFWKFIEDNHLESLLKNVMVIFHLIENFRNYDNNSNYVNIYEKIIKEYIVRVGENREEEDTNRNLDELVLIASSLATYMILNRLSSVSSTNLKKVASECYKINDKFIVADDLKAILKTALFEKNGDEFTFFHKSIQEYLTAYFINYKKLNSKTIKKIFAHKLGFYEEFEEIIIYLTNIQPELFNEFVEIDPFIFRRHPLLTEEQQKKLFIKIVDKLKYKKQTIRANSRFFGKSSLVIFDKVDNLEELVKKHITIREFEYLANILEYNYSKGIEDFFFELLNELKNNKELCFEKIESLRINIFSINERLFYFIKENNIFSKKSNFPFSTSIEEYLFKTLYKKVPFEELIILLEHMSRDEVFSYIIYKIPPKDLLIWLKRVNQLKNYKSSNLEWLIHGVLLNHKAYNSIEDILSKIVKILKNRTKPILNKKFFLFFDDISNDFWKFFFKNQDNYFELEQLLSLYKIESKHINKLTNIYPEKQYKRHYRIIENISSEIEMRKFYEIENDFNHDEELYIEDIKKTVKKDISSLKKEEYKKLFKNFFEKGYIYSSEEDIYFKEIYFTQLIDKYFEEFILFIIKIIEETIKRNSNIVVRYVINFFEKIEKLNKFDAKYIQTLIDYLSQIPQEIYLKLDYEAEEIMVLDILSLGNDKQYNLIKELLTLDKENSKYLTALYKINPNKAIDDFIEIFDYNNAELKSKKEYYKILIEAISQPLYYKYEDKNQFEKIDKNNIKWILIDYYHFFDNYKTPVGYYQPDIYSDMYSYINSLWVFLQKNTQYIKFIEKLSIDKNQRLSSTAKNLLYGLYEKQARERGFDNNYYKNILDKGLLPITSSLDLFNTVKEIWDKDIRNWIESEGAYKFINELAKKERNTKAEDFIQKTIISEIKLGFLRRKYNEESFFIKREEQLLDDKRLDFTIFYQPFSLVVELKLSHNSEAKSTGKDAKNYILKLEQYIKGSKSDFALFVILNVKEEKDKFDKQIEDLKNLYKDKKNIEVIGINCVK